MKFIDNFRDCFKSTSGPILRAIIGEVQFLRRFLVQGTEDDKRFPIPPAELRPGKGQATHSEC